MGWFSRSRAGLRYKGVTYQPFAEWTATPEGVGVLTPLAAAMRFAPFGRMRAARRRLWRDLAAAARDDRLAQAMQAEAERYLPLMAEVAYADGLPCATVDLQRLVVVPRALLNGVMLAGVEERLFHADLTPSLPGGSPLHAFLCRQIVRELDAVVLGVRANPRRALPAAQQWVNVGHDTAFAWTVPLAGEPVWRGHHYLFEVPMRGMNRRVHGAVRARIGELEQTLPFLTRDARQDLLRRAWTPFLPRAA